MKARILFINYKHSINFFFQNTVMDACVLDEQSGFLQQVWYMFIFYFWFLKHIVLLCKNFLIREEPSG